MRFGYWLPVFGGWLRNVENENMEASWPYVKKLAQRSEQIGFDLTLIAELIGQYPSIALGWRVVLPHRRGPVTVFLRVRLAAQWNRPCWQGVEFL